MAVNTTFEMFQQLLQEAVDSDTNLTSTMKAAMKLRVTAMPRTDWVGLGVADALSVAGNVSLDLVNDAILVATGVPATPNRVEFAMQTFATPVSVMGSDGVNGMLLGHTGGAVDAAVATSDVTFQYRLASTDAWAAFTRNTVLSGITSLQIAAVIADQVAATSLPYLWLRATQL